MSRHETKYHSDEDNSSSCSLTRICSHEVSHHNSDLNQEIFFLHADNDLIRVVRMVLLHKRKCVFSSLLALSLVAIWPDGFAFFARDHEYLEYTFHWFDGMLQCARSVCCFRL